MGTNTAFATVNKSMSPAAATSGNGSTTGLSLSAAPAVGSYVAVFVNGWMVWLANGPGEQAAADCYFRRGADPNAIAYGSFASGDTLYWNGNNTHFDLVPTEHYLDFLFGV